MSTKLHSLLTGSDLHEPKGAATATVGQVYASDGAGSGVWKKIDAASLSGLANPFGASLLHARETQASGGGSGTATTGGIVTRILNTIVTNEIVGASLLGNNNISLPAGTYFSIFNGAGAILLTTGVSIITARAFLFDTTHSSYLLSTPTTSLNYIPASGTYTLQVNQPFWGAGRFTLGAASNIDFRHYTNTGGLVLPVAGMGLSEVYSDVFIWKIST